MRLNVRLRTDGCADGQYSVEARGFLAASLHWANEQGPLPDWTALAYMPLDSTGRGCFEYTGGRAVPPEATHVAARVISPDFSVCETLLAPIAASGRRGMEENVVRFGVMSDLHMASKPGRIRRALRLLRNVDCILMTGDLTNDARPSQFEELLQCINEEVDGIPVLAVAGNHDYPLVPLPRIPEGVDDCERFFEQLERRNAALGCEVHPDEAGGFSANVNGVAVFGINAVSHWRRFVFPEGRQLDWLEAELRRTEGGRRILLCHAPLLRHNPARSSMDGGPYLSRDDRLQELLDAARCCCYIAGHTHISFNERRGCVEPDESRENIYLNQASVTPVMLREAEIMTDREWLEGSVAHMTVYGHEIEISAQAISSGRMISRGFYWLPWG